MKIAKILLFSVVATLLALIIRLALFDDILGQQIPFLFFFISITASGWYGGLLGGLTATVLASIASAYSFLAHDGLAINDYIMLTLFAISGAIISVLFQWLHAAQIKSNYLGNILQSTDDAIIAKDLNGVITAWNPAAEHIFGYTALEAIGQPIVKLIIPPERVEEEKDILSKLRRGEKISHFETIRRHKDGHSIEVAVTISPVYDDKGYIIGASKVARDITGYKKLKGRLDEQQQWYQVTLDSIGDAVIATDTNANVVFMNPKSEQMTGWRIQEALNQPLTNIFSIINEDTRHPVQNPVNKVIQQGKIVGLANHTILISKEGKEIPIADTAAPIKTNKGSLVGVVLVFHDVSDNRSLEKQLKAKADMLVEKDRRKDVFLAMLAHELRNPLAPISNTLHILNSPNASEGLQKEAIRFANHQLNHMVRLLDDLLDVSRITHGKIHLQRKRVDLCEIVQTAINSAQGMLNEHRHTLKTDLPPCPVFVNGDSTRLSQLLGNLLNNAVKYTDDGGMIEITVSEEGKDVVIQVRDNGIGIPPQKLPFIFDMFMQADNAIERTHGGLGIGLMLVKNIAELHGGTVNVFSEGVDKGTIFTVRLPIMEEVPESKTESLEKEKPADASQHYRILVVDDNEASAKTLGWMVEALGHKVKIVYNGKSAIEVAHQYKPEIVLLDIGLPDMSGYEVCAELHKDPVLQDTKFIAQTGWGQEKDRQRSKEAGFDSHLIKPVSLEVLEDQLNEIKKAA